MRPHCPGEPGPLWVALCHLRTVQSAPGSWPETPHLIRPRRLVVLHEGVEYICIVARDVIRQDIDSEPLPPFFCSTWLFCGEVQEEKMEQRELGHWLLKHIDQ